MHGPNTVRIRPGIHLISWRNPRASHPSDPGGGHWPLLKAPIGGDSLNLCVPEVVMLAKLA
jgi:hypothetical protein